MLTHEQFKARALENPAVRAEYERLEREEGPMLDAILNARLAAGLTQSEVAQRMGVSPPVVSRLEASLISGKHSPSLATLRKYAAALGRRVQVQFV